MINKKNLIMHFDRNALNYDYYANVQKKMANIIVNRLLRERPKFGRNYKILDIGCGTGTLTKQIAKIYTNAEITAIDISKNMINIARNNLETYNVGYLCADIENVKLGEKFDIIISSATLQWIDCLEDTLSSIVGYMKENGIFLFSTFGENTFNELRTSYDIAKKNLNIKENVYPGQTFFSFNYIMNLISTFRCLKAIGYEKDEIETFDTVKEFLYSVKKIGANNSNKLVNRNPKLIKDMMKIYKENFSTDEKIKATYHCMYFFINNNTL
jgi:malonyl-CoA O-methyltransferase